MKRSLAILNLICSTVPDKRLSYSISGYITPFIMDRVLGSTGGYLLMTMLMMALMSTGSGEVMGISSIVVYDLYKTHIRPFRYALQII